MTDKWKDIVRNVAPVLGAALGSPMAGMAVKVIADGLLGGNAKERDLAKFIETASPDSLVKLKEIESQFECQMEQLGVDVFKSEVSDRANARQYGHLSRVPAMLTFGLSGIITLILLLLFYVEPPAGAKEILLLLLGYVIREWAGTMHYWFGTTRGSKDKTDMLRLLK